VEVAFGQKLRLGVGDEFSSLNSYSRQNMIWKHTTKETNMIRQIIVLIIHISPTYLYTYKPTANSSSFPLRNDIQTSGQAYFSTDLRKPVALTLHSVETILLPSLQLRRSQRISQFEGRWGFGIDIFTSETTASCRHYQVIGMLNNQFRFQTKFC
jgi:hypothetical protein